MTVKGEKKKKKKEKERKKRISTNKPFLLKKGFRKKKKTNLGGDKLNSIIRNKIKLGRLHSQTRKRDFSAILLDKIDK